MELSHAQNAHPMDNAERKRLIMVTPKKEVEPILPYSQNLHKKKM